ncbi:MAG: stage III sporulation protein AF [Clostridia bacterium]|nr:stage III sporulation protein AF [Clostridia bacterium]
MKVYIYSILILAIISGIIKAITSDFSNSTKKYISFICGLVMILVIITPFARAVSNVGNIKEYVNNVIQNKNYNDKIEQSNSIIINTGREKICEGLKEAIISEFEFDPRDVYVDVEIDKSQISSVKITGVNIILTNKASWSNVDDVKLYMENLVGVPVHVTRK